MGELPLRGLLFAVGALALVSCWLKIRKTSSAGLGVSLFTLVEGVLGAGLMVTTIPGVVPSTVSAALGVTTVGAVLVSTISHLMILRELRRAREESSGARLYASVNYGLGNPLVSEIPPEADSPDRVAAGSRDAEGAGFVDPIVAALKTGHFDPDAFLKAQAASQDHAPDSDRSDEDRLVDSSSDSGDEAPDSTT